MSENIPNNAGAPEVTPEMVDAGVMAYYGIAAEGWENPGRAELRKMLEAVFQAMASRAFPQKDATRCPPAETFR